METVLQVLGIIALIVFILVGGVILFFVFRFKFMMRNLRKDLVDMGKEFQAAIAGATPTPTRISLARDTEAEWLREPEARELVEELEDLGFVKGSAHCVPQMPGLNLLDFTHVQHSYRAVLYNHPAIGLFMDMLADIQDGEEVTISSGQETDLEERPNTRKIYLPGQRPAALFERLKQETAGADLKPVSAETFEQDFLQAYREDMQWRVRRGGVSEEEHRRIAEKAVPEMSEEDLREAFVMAKSGEIEQWAEECLETFENSGEISVPVWKEFEDEMVICSEDLHPQGYVHYLLQQFDLEEEEEAQFVQAADNTSRRQILEQLCAKGGAKLTHLGKVEEPITAEIFGLKLPDVHWK